MKGPRRSVSGSNMAEERTRGSKADPGAPHPARPAGEAGAPACVTQDGADGTAGATRTLPESPTVALERQAATPIGAEQETLRGDRAASGKADAP